MGKRFERNESVSAHDKPGQSSSVGRSSDQVVSKRDYLFLATLLEGKDSVGRVQKKNSHADALRDSGSSYEKREYISAYDAFKPAYDKVVADMQRVLARNLEFEANKLAKQMQKPLSVAKERVQSIKLHAQQVIDQFDALLHDLQNKPLVRAYLKKEGGSFVAKPSATNDMPPVAPTSAVEVMPEPPRVAPAEITLHGICYSKRSYLPPAVGSVYSVRDKSRGELFVRITRLSGDGATVDIEVLDGNSQSHRRIQLPVDSLARQAEKGWCSLLIPVVEQEATADGTEGLGLARSTTMRLDIQNFSRCCADIARANIRYDTQLIKDVGDGPFRAGNFDQAFRTFEQLAVGFASAVASSRRSIADGRRTLNSQKGKLSGKEIQERTAALTRSEQLIHTAEREFSSILEGLRIFLRTQQN